MSTPKKTADGTFSALAAEIPLHDQFDEIEVEEEEQAQETVPVVEVKNEVQPVPRGVGGTFVRRGGKLYPRGS